MGFDNRSGVLPQRDEERRSGQGAAEIPLTYDNEARGLAGAAVKKWRVNV